MNAIYKSDFKVRIADADRRGKLKMPAMLQMLQEIATDHAHSIGVGIEHLAPQSLGWALSKMSVKINRLPQWGERVFIKTWPSFRERVATYREFSAADSSGEPLFSARSQWLLFDICERRIARLSRLPEWDMLPECANSETLDEPIERPMSEPILEFKARADDIDLNGHVNNSVFLVWASESLPLGVFDEMRPSRIRINFLEEVLPEYTVKAAVRISGTKTFTSLTSEKSSRECARIAIDWEALP